MSVAQLVLASRSPRRAELLEQMRLKFRCVAADIDETPLSDETAAELVQRLAQRKAMAVADAIKEEPRLPVLGADTVVVVDGQILGKPNSASQAVAHLSRLSGRTHDVLTGVALLGRANKIHVACDSTQVSFRVLDSAEIDRYVATSEPMDKAGAYGIQGFGGVFVERISGSYSNVVGLPVHIVEQFLQAESVDTWRYRS